MINELVTLNLVLAKIDKLPWDYALYIPKKNDNFTSAMKCIVLDADDMEGADADVDPDLAISNELTYALTIQSIQGVVKNLKSQIVNYDLTKALQSLQYYYDNDAFLEY